MNGDHGDHGGHGGHDGDGGDGGHGGHGGHGGDSCSMEMIFNLDTENLCIVFSWWRVNSIGFLILSCFIVALLAATFELLRYLSRKYDSKIYVSSHSQLQEGGSNSEEVGSTPARNNIIRITFAQRLIRTLIYAVQVFLSFFIMLIFMTYNGYIMFSVVIGAAVGYFIFARHAIPGNQELEGRPTCH